MELKPCPFCGGEATLNIAPYIGGAGFGYIVECDKCWSKTGYYSQKAEAVAAWNSRATLGSGTREPNWVLQGKTQTQEFWRCECGNCGHEFGVETRESFPLKMTIGKVDVPNYCPNCGRRVVE